MVKPSETLTVTGFETTAGGRIFQIPLEEFPGFWGQVYVVLVDDERLGPMRVLIDSGSGFGKSNEHLEAGLKNASDMAGEDLRLGSLTHIFITHGHIDHFGGLSYVRSRTQAKLGVHELDLRNLTNYEERLTVVARRLNNFFREAGVSDNLRHNLLLMYKITKSLYSSVRVDFTYEATGMRVGPFEMLHVPGHSAGHVAIRLHDVLFSGDHVLNRTSPHQSPEHLTLSTGLQHYLNSLHLLRSWAAGVRLTLGGHKDPIYDLNGRLDAIEAMHEARLQLVQEFLSEAHTISEVSHHLFGEVEGYNILLALEEAGAHVEYLYQRGILGIQNLKELDHSEGPIPILYQTIKD